MVHCQAECAEKWKKNCPLNDVLRGEVDGRTVSGMLKCAERLRAEEATRMAGAILTNYHKVVKSAERLVQTKLSQIPQQELTTTLECMQEQGATLPPRIKRDLLRRHTGGLVKAGFWEELIAVVNPFAPSDAFDATRPTVAASEETMEGRLKAYGSLVIDSLMTDWLAQGEAGAGQVLQFAKLAQDAFEKVDCIDLDIAYSRDFGEQVTIFRACKALLENTVSTEHQENLLFFGFFCSLWRKLGELAALKCQCKGPCAVFKRCLKPQYFPKPVYKRGH